MWCVPSSIMRTSSHGGPSSALRKAAFRKEPVVCLDEKPVQLHDSKRSGHVASDGNSSARLRVSTSRDCEPLRMRRAPRSRHIVKTTQTRDRFGSLACCAISRGGTQGDSHSPCCRQPEHAPEESSVRCIRRREGEKALSSLQHPPRLSTVVGSNQAEIAIGSCLA